MRTRRSNRRGKVCRSTTVTEKKKKKVPMLSSVLENMPMGARGGSMKNIFQRSNLKKAKIVQGRKEGRVFVKKRRKKNETGGTRSL